MSAETSGSGGAGPGGSSTERLFRSIERSGGVVSVGLEPSLDRLPDCFARDLDGLERCLMAVVEGAFDGAAAFKANLAFFEVFGSAGWAMLERVRGRIGADAFFIADAKRGDIGSSAERYAEAMFGWLGADAVTVNPLMGADAVEPFLAWEDRLTYALCLTSNPGSREFLLEGDLFVRIAERMRGYGGGGSRGLVVGATADSCALGRLAAVSGDLPLLIPGVGAQGGDAGRVSVAFGDLRSRGALVHSTRGVLPGEPAGDAGSYAAGVSRLVRCFSEAVLGGSSGGVGLDDGSSAGEVGGGGGSVEGAWRGGVR